MTSRDFCFFLQGFFEVSNPKTINEEQTKMIQAHLNLVFVHEIDPSMGNQEHQDKLNKIHNEGKSFSMEDYQQSDDEFIKNTPDYLKQQKIKDEKELSVFDWNKEYPDELMRC